MFHMKKLTALLLACTLTFASCSEDDIAPIQKDCVKTLANIKNYRVKTIDLTGLSDVTGTINGYFNGKDLVMATVTTYGDTGRAQDTYFFENDRLTCSQQEQYIYNKPTYYTQERAIKNGDSVWYDDAKTVRKVSYFYFYEKRMIKWIDRDKKTMPDTDPRYRLQKELLLSDAEKLVKMLREK